MKKHAYLEISRKKDIDILLCSGVWRVGTISEIEKKVFGFDCIKKNLLIDFSKVEDFDSAGILVLVELYNRCSKAGAGVDIRGLTSKQAKMYELLSKNYNPEPIPKRKEGFFFYFGKGAFKLYDLIRDFIRFSGELSVAIVGLIKNPKRFRFKEMVYHIEKTGFNALMIIGLTSFLVGLVIAYQSIVQLAKFGADIFVVDTTAISITRELGPMITAIVIAGRSASSFTAEIGTMRLTEEISAMRTMGFDPWYFLVIPRIAALIISLPLLIFFSDIIGIIGGMVATKAQVGMSFDFFTERLREVLELKNYIIGIAKGPFFAFIIAMIGSFHGFRVTKDTESIGIETTTSVVHAIFLVIACDAIFSVIFTQLGI